MFSILKKLSSNLRFYYSRKLNYPLIPPRNITLTLDYICNQNCIMCEIKKKPFNKDHRLKPAEIKTLIIDQMAEMKIPELVITGGEPTMYEGLIEVIDYANSKNIKVILITNAFFSKEQADKLIKAKPAHIQISLDGHTKELYEKIRGAKDSFEAVTENIKYFIDKHISVGVTATINKYNCTHILDIADFAKSLGANRLAIRPAHADNSDPNIHNPEEFIPKTEILEQFKNSIPRLKEYNHKHNEFIEFSPGFDLLPSFFENNGLVPEDLCYIGYTRLIISYNEKESYEIWMCGGMLGDIRKAPLAKLWKSKQAKNLRKQIKKCKKACLFPELYEPQLKNLRTIFFSK